MMKSSSIFEKNYQEYCARIAKIDFSAIIHTLGIEHDGSRMYIPFFNNRYIVSHNGIEDESGHRPDYVTSVILAKYILLCPAQSYCFKEWVAFKDFKRVSHFTNVNYFSSDTERAIERHFSGNMNDLKRAGEALDGTRYEMEMPYDLAIQFTALPRISLLLLFNDGDEEFSAKCTVLFQKHAEYYLDPESLAVTSACLARNLQRQAFA